MRSTPLSLHETNIGFTRNNDYKINAMNQKLIQDTLKETIVENSKNRDWVNLAHIGSRLMENGLDYKALGYPRLLDLIKANTDVIELQTDTNHKLPVYSVRVRNKTSVSAKKRTLRETPKSALFNWAYLGHYETTIQNLKDLTLNERWYYKRQSSEMPFPILVNYLHYTFYRLLKEKDKIFKNERFAVFNTGLVDKRYEPIYAFFEKNQNNAQEWRLVDFCIAGEGRAGKDIIRNFSDKPDRAHYFKNVSDLLYDSHAPKPELDWKHIILDNISRIPLSFIDENAPREFEVKNPALLSIEERKRYFENLRTTVDKDTKSYRNMTNRFKDALELSLKRVEWNFKTAIPMYYPTQNKMSLLLPLALVDDDIVDIALVVEKTRSGNYLGHTILPLNWAYSNARLVARPDSDWLVAEEIELESTIEDESS